MPSNWTRRRVLRALAASLSSTAVGSPVAARRAGRSSSSGGTGDGGDPPGVAWSHEFGSSGNDEPVDSVSAHDGGVVLLVAARGATSDVWVAKFGPSGSRKWTRQYELWGHDDPHGIVRTAQGYVVAGYGGRGNHRHKPWLLGLAADGTDRWKRFYDDPPGRYQLEALSRSPDGGFVFGGHVDRDSVDGGEAVWLMRTDGDGRKRWLQTYRDFAWLTDVVRSRPDGYALVGHSHVETSDGGRGVEATILEVDDAGTERWRRTFGGANSDRLQTVRRTPAGYLVGGGTNSPAEPGGLLMALDPRGRTIWQRVFPEAGVRDATPLADGYAFVGGGRLVRTDGWGRVTWSAAVDGDGLRTVTRLADQLVVGARTSYRGQDVGSQAWVGGVSIE